MFDSLTVARRLTDAGMNRELADATDRAPSERRPSTVDHATPEFLRVEALSALETLALPIKRLDAVGTVIARSGQRPSREACVSIG